MAPDRPGIVSEVIRAIVEQQWTICEVWAETRFGTFFLAVGLASELGGDSLDERVAQLQKVLEARSFKVVPTLKNARFMPDDAATDVMADISIEGDRRVDILQKMVDAIAGVQASIVSVRTEGTGASLRYVVQTRYDHTLRPRVQHALAEVSADNEVDFTTETLGDEPT
jgi:glycine cleavage system regulatory protein